MNYGELQATIADYIHRADLTPQIPGFITLAQSRIERDLRIQEMMVYATLTPTDNPFLLPDDFLELRELSRAATNNTGRVQLTSVGRHELNHYQGSTGVSSLFYNISGRYLETVPNGASVEYEIIYYGKPTKLENTGDTNAVLDRYPSLYLYGAMIEAYSWIQDQANQARCVEIYNSEVQAANQASKYSEAGESMQMGGAGWL